jgi:hypothetical protein
MRSSHYSVSCDRPGRSWADRQTYVCLMGLTGPRTLPVSHHPCCHLNMRQPASSRILFYFSSHLQCSLDKFDINSGWDQSTFSCSTVARSLFPPTFFLTPTVCFCSTYALLITPLCPNSAYLISYSQLTSIQVSHDRNHGFPGLQAVCSSFAPRCYQRIIDRVRKLVWTWGRIAFRILSSTNRQRASAPSSLR